MVSSLALSLGKLGLPRCLLIATVFAAVLWLAETWHTTVRQASRLESWAARLAARIAQTRPHSAEEPGDFWRRWHRAGHNLMLHCGGGLNVRRRRRLHSFAGHLARSEDGFPYQALRTRGLAWWRAVQAQSLFPHPRRFKPWRWEEQLETYYGRQSSIFIDENVGWMLRAQDRKSWRVSESQYAFAP